MFLLAFLWRVPVLHAVHVQLPKIPISHTPGILAGKLAFEGENQASETSLVTGTGSVQLSDERAEIRWGVLQLMGLLNQLSVSKLKFLSIWRLSMGEAQGHRFYESNMMNVAKSYSHDNKFHVASVPLRGDAKLVKVGPRLEATVIGNDSLASNGVVHIIDTVMLPSAVVLEVQDAPKQKHCEAGAVCGHFDHSGCSYRCWRTCGDVKHFQRVDTVERKSLGMCSACLLQVLQNR